MSVSGCIPVSVSPYALGKRGVKGRYAVEKTEEHDLAVLALRGSNGTAGVVDGALVRLPVAALKRSRHQHRTLTPAVVREMANAIQRQGLIQPVEARWVDGGWELTVGHCRLEAHRLLLEELPKEEAGKWREIAVVARTGLDDAAAALRTAAENLVRRDASTLEQAMSCLEVKRAAGLGSNGEVAERLGLGSDRVDRLLRLAEGPEFLRSAVGKGVLVEAKEAGESAHFVKLELMHAMQVLRYWTTLSSRSRAALASNAAPNGVQKAEREAQARTSRLMERITRGGWSVVRTKIEVDALLGGGKREGEGARKAKGEAGRIFKSPKGLLVRRGQDLTFRLSRWEGVDEAERTLVLEELEGLLATLKKNFTDARLRRTDAPVDGGGDGGGSGARDLRHVTAAVVGAVESDAI
jgi:ParB-like chromosome segregation protein Spo0J